MTRAQKIALAILPVGLLGVPLLAYHSGRLGVLGLWGALFILLIPFQKRFRGSR